MSSTDPTFYLFELEADAWDFVYDQGFVATLDDHRSFEHPDGRRAVIIPGDARDPRTEVKMFLPDTPVGPAP